MTQEEKLILEDLCVRLPYKPKLKIGEHCDYTLIGVDISKEKPIIVELDGHIFEASCKNVRPVLRSLSSMTIEEERKLNSYGFILYNNDEDFDNDVNREINRSYIDKHNVVNCYKFLISRYFDVNNFIPRGLAVEALPDMYKNP